MPEATSDNKRKPLTAPPRSGFCTTHGSFPAIPVLSEPLWCFLKQQGWGLSLGPLVVTPGLSPQLGEMQTLGAVRAQQQELPMGISVLPLSAKKDNPNLRGRHQLFLFHVFSPLWLLVGLAWEARAGTHWLYHVIALPRLPSPKPLFRGSGGR